MTELRMGVHAPAHMPAYARPPRAQVKKARRSGHNSNEGEKSLSCLQQSEHRSINMPTEQEVQEQIKRTQDQSKAFANSVNGLKQIAPDQNSTLHVDPAALISNEHRITIAAAYAAAKALAEVSQPTWQARGLNVAEAAVGTAAGVGLAYGAYCAIAAIASLFAPKAL